MSALRKFGVALVVVALLWSLGALWFWAVVGCDPNVGTALMVTPLIVGGAGGACIELGAAS